MITGRNRKKVCLFNNNPMSSYESSHVLVSDKSMSTFIPRQEINLFAMLQCPSFSKVRLFFFSIYLEQRKKSILPNIAYIKRKPEPLGTEFINIVDRLTGAILWLEIQEGKSRMATKEYQYIESSCDRVLRGGCDIEI